MKHFVAICFFVFVLGISNTSTTAATYDIADGDVSGLISAIHASNTSVGPDTINLAHRGTYILTYIAGPDSYHGPTGLPIVQGTSGTQRTSLTINGNGSTIQRSTSPGTPEFRIFYALYANVILDSVVIKGGIGRGSVAGGGGLYINVSSLVLRNSTVTENWGLEAGAIYNTNTSQLTIENSTISYNTADGARSGGAILNFTSGSHVSISNSTLFENHAGLGRGDAIATGFTGPNSVSVKNSIIASPSRGNNVGDDCFHDPPSDTIQSLGHNIFSDTTCGQNVTQGDWIVQDLALGALSDNGGLTPTQALPGGSQAIDAVSIADCFTISGEPVSVDQRGALRPAGAACDIGAFEFNGNLDGLVSYWPGEDHTNDVIGPNNGTFQNGAAYAPGIVGRAFSLDGVSQYIVVPDSTSLSQTGALTLSAWIKLNSNNRQQAIIEKYDVPALNGYLLRITDGGKVQSTVCNTSTCSQPPATGATTVSTATWHHVAGVYDGVSIRVYLDGVLDGSSATTFVPTDGATTLKIGARGDDANTRFGGSIDEVRIYNRALTAAEISEAASLDSTPPLITPNVSGTLGNNSWYTSDVQVDWSVTDEESAISSSDGCDLSSVTIDTLAVAFTCSATSAGGTNTQSVTIKRDATAPIINVAAPINGTYLLNQSVIIDFACSDPGSGVASCTGSASNGSSLDTGTPGTKSLTVIATDNAGNTAQTAISYTVGFGVQALFDQTKAHRSGSTVPIKVRLVDANGLNVSSAGIVLHAVSVVQTSSQASTTLDDSGNSNPDLDFRYDAALGGYIFNLKTSGYGTGTYLLNFVAEDSTTYSVGFQVRQ